MKSHMVACGKIWAAVLLVTASLPAQAQWVNEQAADFVIGKGTFDNNTDNGPSASRISNTHAVAVDPINGKLYVGDTFRHRVLRFSYPITANGPAAEMVFGQSDFTGGTSNAGGLSASSLNLPTGLTVDSTGRLYIGDFSNNRVLIFDAAHTISGNKPSANRVLGQPGFTSNGTAVSVNGMSGPNGLRVDDNGALWLCDRSNNRVLRFDNVAAKPNGSNADGVLGQANFTSSGVGGGTSGMNQPEGVALVGTTLFVADASNHRVLRFDTASSKANGAAADGVLGQADFSGNTSGLAQNRFNYPSRLASDQGGRLYVPENQNHRVLVFDNAASKANGANADIVIGQQDFVTNQLVAAQNRLGGPTCCEVDQVNHKLLTAEYNNARVVLHSASGSLPVSISGFEIE